MVDMLACDASTGGTGSGSVGRRPPPLHGLVPVKPRHLLSSDIPHPSPHRQFNDHHTIIHACTPPRPRPHPYLIPHPNPTHTTRILLVLVLGFSVKRLPSQGRP